DDRDRARSRTAARADPEGTVHRQRPVAHPGTGGAGDGHLAPAPQRLAEQAGEAGDSGDGAAPGALLRHPRGKLALRAGGLGSAPGPFQPPPGDAGGAHHPLAQRRGPHLPPPGGGWERRRGAGPHPAPRGDRAARAGARGPRPRRRAPQDQPVQHPLPAQRL
ncbi:MAG: hypothetical protein AVDCRST_MAG68-4783, partial [uncultured Gemmatimonadetes bacterium]